MIALMLACAGPVAQDTEQPEPSPELDGVSLNWISSLGRFTAQCVVSPAQEESSYTWTVNGAMVQEQGRLLEGLRCEDEVICRARRGALQMSSDAGSPQRVFGKVLAAEELGGALLCYSSCGTDPPAPFSWEGLPPGPVLWPQARDGERKECRSGDASVRESPQPATPRLSVSFDSKEPARLGFDVVAVGDMDGDGGQDLAIAMPYWDSPSPKAGGVALVSSGTLGTLDHHSLSPRWTGEGSADLAGWALAAAGDVDGDGLADLLVGIPGDERQAYLGGAVALITGADLAQVDAVVGQAWRLWTGDQSRMWAGTAVAGGADLDGDRGLDVLVGAYGDDQDAGAVFLLDAQSPSGSLVDPVLRGSPGSATGLSLAIIGDTDGDGVQEWVAGAPLDDSLWWAQGEERELHQPSDLEGAYFAWKVAGFGDIDGDGLVDWGASEPGGGCWLHTAEGWQDLGLPSTNISGILREGEPAIAVTHQGTLWAITLDSAEPLYSSQGTLAIAPVPDLDGDRLGELLIGAAGANEESGGALLLLGI